MHVSLPLDCITSNVCSRPSGTVFLRSLNVMDPFTATIVKRAVVLAACIFVIVFVERIGRRRLCLIVGSMCAACLLIMGGLGTITPRQAGTSNGILALTIVFTVLYMVGFGSTYVPLVQVLSLAKMMRYLVCKWSNSNFPIRVSVTSPS